VSIKGSGEQGVVIAHYQDSYYPVRVRFDNSNADSNGSLFHEDELELLPQFKPGDRVRATSAELLGKAYLKDRISVGDTGTIDSLFEGEKWWVRFDNDDAMLWMYADGLEKIEEEIVYLELKVGDKVRITDDVASLEKIYAQRGAGKTGILRRVDKRGTMNHVVDFVNDDGHHEDVLYLNRDQIEKVEQDNSEANPETVHAVVANVALQKEFDDFKAKVLEVALREQKDRDWCNEEFYPVLKELGLNPPEGKSYLVTLRVNMDESTEEPLNPEDYFRDSVLYELDDEEFDATLETVVEVERSE
jgi:hypothetical protein